MIDLNRCACFACAVFSAIALARPAAAAEVGYYSRPALHGNRLVLVSEGDLWTADLAGGSGGAPIVAYRLTSSDGTESHPVISPDGDRIVFAAEYEGNTDVYLMPIDGGEPRRLTFHPARDQPIGWTPDGSEIIFRSDRRHPFGRFEAFRISPGGGMPRADGFGECSMIAYSATGRRFAFTPWSNENWHWKGYRGGTAPEIWVGNLQAERFDQLTDDPANDLFPMWLLGRVYFISDRAGTFNLFSDSPAGGDLKQHTSFEADDEDPTAIEGYDIRWPAADAARRGTRIVFCQGGALALFDATNETVTRLDVRIASDRVAARRRFTDPNATISEMMISPDGETLIVGTRGELVAVDVETGVHRQLTHTSGARERAASFIDDERIALISDQPGEQQIAIMPVDGSSGPGQVTFDLEQWLFRPVISPDGAWLAVADNTMRLHLLDMQLLNLREVDRGKAGEITDYRFSPDGRWLAYTKRLPSGYDEIFLYSIRSRRSFPIGDGISSNFEPRWDPKGKYLFFLSNRHFDPVLGRFDLEHVYVKPTQVYALPLAKGTPAPMPEAARAAGFDLKEWSRPPKPEPDDAAAEDVEAAAEAAEEAGVEPDDSAEAIVIDTDGMAGRHVRLPIEAGRYDHLEAIPGGVLYLDRRVEGMLDQTWPPGPFGPSNATLRTFSLVEKEGKSIAEEIPEYVLSASMTSVAYPAEGAMTVRSLEPGAEPNRVDVSTAQVRVNVREEWRQMFDEAWRLQRDFYWDPDMVGVDWEAMRERYAALLPRVGTRDELNDLIGEMQGELGTSHAYIWGGIPQDRVEPVSVGLLGADIDLDGVFRISRIIPRQPWDESLESPLAAPHLDLSEGDMIVAINGQALTVGANLYDLLQDQAGKWVRLTIADGETGENQRTIVVEALASERDLRYWAWVDANRAAVAEASDGAIGYIHIPDMGAAGLAAFSRQFFPQYRKRAFVIDIRNNGGGFVSQMILERLAREVLAFQQPRHGIRSRYPERAPHAHMVCLIDQFAGSDGDIFPAAFRAAALGPLIGTRTWGGVIGIRGDKRFVDTGLATQPEFAWRDFEGWSLENVGVEPDIRVPITPGDRLADRDPQLRFAIRHLLEQLEADPMHLPDPPPYPTRVPR